MPNIGPLEIAIVLAIALVVFGPAKLPELGKSAGKGFREFKNSVSGDRSKEDLHAQLEDVEDEEMTPVDAEVVTAGR